MQTPHAQIYPGSQTNNSSYAFTFNPSQESMLSKYRLIKLKLFGKKDNLRNKRYFEITWILHCSRCIFWLFRMHFNTLIVARCSKQHIHSSAAITMLKLSEIVFFLWIVTVQPKKLNLSYFLKDPLYNNHYGWCLAKCSSLHNWNICPIIMFHYFDW